MARESLRERGAAITELAIGFSLLVLIVLGGIQYSWIFQRTADAAAAARDGVRFGVVAGRQTSEVEVFVGDLLAARGFPAGSYSISVSPDPESLKRGGLLNVTVVLSEAAYGLGLGLIPIPGDYSYTASMSSENAAE